MLVVVHTPGPLHDRTVFVKEAVAGWRIPVRPRKRVKRPTVAHINVQHQTQIQSLQEQLASVTEALTTLSQLQASQRLPPCFRPVRQLGFVMGSVSSNACICNPLPSLVNMPRVKAVVGRYEYVFGG